MSQIAESIPMTRRSAFARGSAVAAGFLASGTGVARADEDWTTRLSTSVLDGAMLGVANLYSKTAAKTQTANDVVTCQVGLSILYAHFQEIGFNASVDQKVHSNAASMIGYQWSPADVDALVKQISKWGITLTPEALSALMDADKRSDGVKYIETNGTASAEMQVISLLTVIEKKLQKTKHARVAENGYLRLVQDLGGSDPSEEDIAACQQLVAQYQAIIKTMVLLSTMYGLTATIGSIACPPCAAIAASLALTAALIDLELTNYCSG